MREEIVGPVPDFGGVWWGEGGVQDAEIDVDVAGPACAVGGSQIVRHKACPCVAGDVGDREEDCVGGVAPFEVVACCTGEELAFGCFLARGAACRGGVRVWVFVARGGIATTVDTIAAAAVAGGERWSRDLQA